jgi:O-acetyl-ADP-ribose deacetylase (regulator of RNase III)
MTGGSGVDGIIHRAAGHKLYNACVAHKQIYPGVRLPTGHSRILLSYDMSPTTYHIINTAGPVYSRHAAKECAEQLSSCYKTALALANLYDLESIGFTAISCGIFGYVSTICYYMVTSNAVFHSQQMTVLKLHFTLLMKKPSQYL